MLGPGNDAWLVFERLDPLLKLLGFQGGRLCRAGAAKRGSEVCPTSGWLGSLGQCQVDLPSVSFTGGGLRDEGRTPPPHPDSSPLVDRRENVGVGWLPPT